MKGGAEVQFKYLTCIFTQILAIVSSCLVRYSSSNSLLMSILCLETINFFFEESKYFPLTIPDVFDLFTVPTIIHMNNFFIRIITQYDSMLTTPKNMKLQTGFSLPLWFIISDSQYSLLQPKLVTFFVPLIRHIFSSPCDFAYDFSDKWNAHFWNTNSSEPPSPGQMYLFNATSFIP